MAPKAGCPRADEPLRGTAGKRGGPLRSGGTPRRDVSTVNRPAVPARPPSRHCAPSSRHRGSPKSLEPYGSIISDAREKYGTHTAPCMTRHGGAKHFVCAYSTCLSVFLRQFRASGATGAPYLGSQSLISSPLLNLQVCYRSLHARSQDVRRARCAASPHTLSPPLSFYDPPSLLAPPVPSIVLRHVTNPPHVNALSTQQ